MAQPDKRQFTYNGKNYALDRRTIYEVPRPKKHPSGRFHVEIRPYMDTASTYPNPVVFASAMNEDEALHIQREFDQIIGKFEDEQNEF